MMVKRNALLQEIENKITKYKVTTLLGPRQCGKTTIAREIGSHTDSVYSQTE